MIATVASEWYGVDGVFCAGWAFLPELEARVYLLHLEREKRRRDGVPESASESTDPEVRLAALLMRRWWRRYVADQRRQRVVAEKLGIAWPPVGAARGERPFVWAHEPLFGRVVPVCYAHDWDSSSHPDIHGFAPRWKPGEVLVIDPDEIVVDAEVLEPEPEPRRPRARPRARPLPDGIPDAEVVEPVPRRRSTPSLGRGVQIGTWNERDGFVPTSNRFGLFG